MLQKKRNILLSTSWNACVLYRVHGGGSSVLWHPTVLHSYCPFHPRWGGDGRSGWAACECCLVHMVVLCVLWSLESMQGIFLFSPEANKKDYLHTSASRPGKPETEHTGEYPLTFCSTSLLPLHTFSGGSWTYRTEQPAIVPSIAVIFKVLQLRGAIGDSLYSSEVPHIWSIPHWSRIHSASDVFMCCSWLSSQNPCKLSYLFCWWQSWGKEVKCFAPSQKQSIHQPVRTLRLFDFLCFGNT